MIANAPAKLNLFLRILAREASGFHQIESLFCALELSDEIEAERTTSAIKIEITTDKKDDASGALAKHLKANPRENLVHKAATAFFKAARLEDCGAHITLKKRIPSGAGLGGGSSDAAATLALLNELYGRPLGNAQMLDTAATLGSDVPFFLCGSPLALAWGRGTRLLPLEPLPSNSVVLVAPRESVSTADAYSALAMTRADAYVANPAVHDGRAFTTWKNVQREAVNDFEPVIFAKIPALARIKADLERHGALIALMTGSGSVVFGVFEDDEHARGAADAVAKDFRSVRVMRTRTAARDLSFSAPPPSLP